MDSNQFLLLIPGIIYGVGLVDLLQVFRSKIYWEIIAMAVLLFLTLIVNWFILSQELSSGTENLAVYTLTMLSPLLFARACNVLTPDAGETDTKSHFLQIIKPFFILLASHTALNIIIQTLVYDDGLNVFRYIGVPIFLACAFYPKRWLRIGMMIIFFMILAFVFLSVKVSY